MSLAGLSGDGGQVHLADGVIAFDRGGSRVVEGLIHLGFDALQLAGHFGGFGARVVGQHELDGGDGRLYLVDPQFHVTAVGGLIVAQGCRLLG